LFPRPALLLVFNGIVKAGRLRLLYLRQRATFQILHMTNRCVRCHLEIICFFNACWQN